MNRADFPILNETVHGRPLVYLDNAATSQKPQAVIDAITEAYTHWNSNIHRGVHHLSQVATKHHEEARQAVANFIGAKSSDEIIFTKGTTDSLNALAFSFGETFIHEGDEILVSAVEHHSNIVPWQMLCERKKAVLRHIPLREDQMPHMPVNVQTLDCDFLAFSGHKMYGPTGIGVLYGKREWLEKLTPHEGGGEMINHVRWSGTTYNELPYKFEAGTPNFVGSYALHKAIEYMQTIGFEAIEAHERELTEYCESQLTAIEGVHIYAAGQPKAGVISFNVYASGNLIHPFDIGTLLDQQGVAVRTGHHCAEPLIDELGVPGTVRVSFGLYNDKADIDAFIAALKKAIVILS